MHAYSACMSPHCQEEAGQVASAICTVCRHTLGTWDATANRTINLCVTIAKLYPFRSPPFSLWPHTYSGGYTLTSGELPGPGGHTHHRPGHGQPGGDKPAHTANWIVMIIYNTSLLLCSALVHVLAWYMC